MSAKTQAASPLWQATTKVSDIKNDCVHHDYDMLLATPSVAVSLDDVVAPDAAAAFEAAAALDATAHRDAAIAVADDAIVLV